MLALKVLSRRTEPDFTKIQIIEHLVKPPSVPPSRSVSPTSRSSADSVRNRPMASLMTSVSSRSGWSAVMLFLFSSSHSWKPVFGLNAHMGNPGQSASQILVKSVQKESEDGFRYLLFSASSAGEAGGGASGCLC